MLSDIPAQNDPRVLIDFRTADDAGVYRWESGPALVQTVDFFTPIVDDPFLYGQIAAANSVSDVYAMGGRPLTALAIAAFPESGLEPEVIRQIFKGGFEKLREAGVALLGGHTVRDREIKFGYAVTGAIDPSRILANGGAKPGDVLFLTKPLGTGIIGTAIKFERASASMVEQAVESMRTLNKAAAAAIQTLPASAVHACTDITGFGLAGHGTEMARASGVTLRLEAAALPVFEGVLEIAAQNRSGGMSSNQAHFAAGVRTDTRGASHGDSHGARHEHIIFDPQTSGGLLVAVDADAESQADQAFASAGVRAWKVGRVVDPVSGVHIDMV